MKLFPNMTRGDSQNWYTRRWWRAAGTSAGWRRADWLADHALRRRRPDGTTDRRDTDYMREEYRTVHAFLARHGAGIASRQRRAVAAFGRPLRDHTTREPIPVSAQHVALLSWGHDPTRANSPLRKAHLRWSRIHGIDPNALRAFMP